MKTLKLLFISLGLLMLNSCIVVDEVENNYVVEEPMSLNQLIQTYDLWYVDIHKTTGDAEVPFLQKAFTITFDNGRIFANNNIVNIGRTGNGYGVKVGNFYTYSDILETSHTYGESDFRIVQISDNEIRLEDTHQNVSYFLVGYMIEDFDYDKLFYDNIEYFLQKYEAWERVNVKNGRPNIFDREHYLNFLPENDNTFRSSEDNFGTNIDYIVWDYVGNYLVEDYQDSNIKRLTLYYDNNETEVFDLEVINDNLIRLIHLKTRTIYEFEGLMFKSIMTKSKNNKTKKNKRSRRKIVRPKIKA